MLDEIVAGAVPNDLSVEADVAPDLAVVANPLVLDRVVSKLVINAARHGAPPIRVAAEQADRHLHVSVEDSGAGVPEELRERLFDRFTRSEAGPGSNLGLAIARAYARAHGGDLVYRDDRQGARFELIVPQPRSAARQARTQARQ